jgi:hypothetical protein
MNIRVNNKIVSVSKIVSKKMKMQYKGEIRFEISSRIYPFE